MLRPALSPYDYKKLRRLADPGAARLRRVPTMSSLKFTGWVRTVALAGALAAALLQSGCDRGAPPAPEPPVVAVPSPQPPASAAGQPAAEQPAAAAPAEAPAAAASTTEAPAQPAQPAESAASAPAATPEVATAEETESTDPPAANPNISFGRLAGLHRAKDDLRLTASAAVVVDQKNGETLYAKNPEAVLPIASLTKLMTAIVIAQAKVPLDETITITDDDVDRERRSRSRVRVGTSMTRAEALHLALMSSENRAAHALGRTFPGGMDAFVARMNAQAKQLGMTSTVFVDPTGLSNRNQSNVRDLALLAAEASRHELLRDYSVTPRRVVALGERILQYNNSNRLVKDPDWEILLQKTGYIVEAGQCLAMRTRLAGRDVVLVLLDAGSRTARTGDAERIRRWMYAEAGMKAPQTPVARVKAPEKKMAKASAKAKDKDRQEAKASKRAKQDVKEASAKKGAKADRQTAKARAPARSKHAATREKDKDGGS